MAEKFPDSNTAGGQGEGSRGNISINQQGTSAVTAGVLQVNTLHVTQNVISPQTTKADQETGKTVDFAGHDSSLTLEQLKANLRQKYKTLRMKGLPWMEDLCLYLDNHYVSLEMVKKIRDMPNASSNKFELEEIFHSLSNWTHSIGKQKSCKVLVEGDAGFGKTTLASKLCYDYSNSKNYMQQFDVVLLFPLRNFSGCLDEMICKAAFVTTKQCSSLSEIIKSECVQTLIILDGYDELAQEHVNSILPLIRGEILPHVSLVVTSRPGRLSEKKSGHTADVKYDMEPVWDCQYKLIGLNEKRQAEFVERHLKNFSPDEKRRIEREIKEMKEKKILPADFLKCPLFFLMVVLILSEENHDLQYVRTITELYKKVFNFVIRRYLTKHSVPDASKCDLFSFDNANRPLYVNLIAKLGEISLSALKTEQVCFSQEMISKLNPEILKIGILTEMSFVKGLKEAVYYEPIHKSLIEFAAAYSLLISFADSPSDQWNKTIVDLRPTKRSFTSLVLPFLAGLMENKAGALFDAIQPNADEYSDDRTFHTLTHILPELQMSDMRSLIPFLPSIWQTYWDRSGIYSSFLPPEIMLQGLKAGKIKMIWWSLSDPVCFTEDIKVANLILEHYRKMCPLNENRFKRIECQSLTCNIEGAPSEQESKAILSLVSSVHFQRLSFHLSHLSTPKFLPLLSESLIKVHLNQTSIHKITCWLKTEKASDILDLLIDLIKRERIKSLHIPFYFFLPTRQHLQPLFETIAKSSCFTEFQLHCAKEAWPIAVELAKLHIENKICRIYKWGTDEIIYSS